MRKRILRILIAVLVVLVLLVAGVWIYLDRLVAVGLEKSGRYALQVDTRVNDVSLSLLRGKLDIGRLTFGNPEGYATPHLLQTDKFHMTLQTGSLFSDVVEIDEVRFQGIDLYLERVEGKTNVARVIDNAKRLGGEKKPGEAEKEGKNVRIKHVLMENITAHVLLLGSEESSALTINVKDLELHDIGTDQPQGETVAQVIARLLPAVVVAVLENAGDKLPLEYAKELTGRVTELTAALGEDAGRLLEQAGGETGQAIREQSDKLLKDAGESLKKGAEDVGGLLKDILPGKKQDQLPPE